MSIPVLDINPLIAAIDAAVTARGVPFGDSNRPSDLIQDQPYVVAFNDGGRITDQSLVSRDGMRVSIVFQTYAWSPDAVRIGRRKAIEAFFGLAGTTVGGWYVHLPVHNASMAIEREDKLSPPLFWQSDDFGVRLSPA